MNAKQHRSLLAATVAAIGVGGALAGLLFSKKEKKSKELLLIGALAGGAAGLTTALLTTPQSGSELIKKAESLKNELWHPVATHTRHAVTKHKKKTEETSKPIKKRTHKKTTPKIEHHKTVHH